ncbi:MAG: hypothetical protein LQ345_006186 [Seirophora villosa]|nr:MAG: hypothetical protein LQ345_006186 [Seirophora villosa]
MFEFPSSRNDWRLDIVSILAVLGESHIKIHAQAITASRLCLLPRLLPNPQALLQQARPKRLPLPPYAVQTTEIGWTRGQEKVPVVYRTLAPLNVVAIASSLLSIAVLIWSALLHDGVAFIGVLLISLASSALGYASYWRRNLPNRVARRMTPIEEIVLQTRWEAFVIVLCKDDIARSLYWQPEDCRYASSSRAARLLGGVVGGLMVLAGVVLFANCSSWAMQAAIGTSYATLNVVYWLVTVMPEAWSWDLRCYDVRSRQDTVQHPNFIAAVSSAIRLTWSTRWVHDHQVLPKSAVWSRWLEMAEEQLDKDYWDAEKSFDDCIEGQSAE